jgi:type IV pilus assembly protein PilW
MTVLMTAPVPAHRQRNASKREAGLSLVELLVGLAIGLLAMLVVFQVCALFEARRRVTVASSDAQINGTQVLMAIERDLKLAGYGLGPASAQGCLVKRYFNSAQPDLVLQAVKITNGVAGTADSLRMLASTALEASVATNLVTPHTGEMALMMVNSTLGIATNDLLILHEPGKTCALIQASAVPAGDFQVTLSRSMSRTHTDVSTPLAAEIVNLQAQYGFDTRTGTQATPQVTWWSDSMMDADGDGVVGNSGDIQRIYAIRFAVVARSQQASAACASQAAPVWFAGGNDGKLAETTIAVDQIAGRPCDRFQVFQSVVPLRNRVWGDA